MSLTETRTAPMAASAAAGGLFAMASAIGIGRFVFTPILPVMIEALHLSKTQAGLIAAANFLGYLVGALLAAVPALPGSRRAWLLAALLMNAVATVAPGLVSTLPLLMAIRLTGGAASAFVLVLASSLVLDRLAVVRRSNLAWVHFAGVGLGIAGSAVLVAVLLAIGADWRELWFGSGGAALLGLFAVAWLVPADAASATGPHAGGANPHRHGLLSLAIAYGLFGFGYVITATFLVAIVRSAALPPGAETGTWLVVGLTAAPSVAFWSAMASRIGRRSAFSLACLLQAVGVAASVLWPTAAGAMLASVLLGGTFMGQTALGLAEARALAPTNPRPTLALITVVFGVGQMAGPVVAGFLSDLTGGYGAASLLAAGVLIVAALVVRLHAARF